MRRASNWCVVFLISFGTVSLLQAQGAAERQQERAAPPAAAPAAGRGAAAPPNDFFTYQYTDTEGQVIPDNPPVVTHHQITVAGTPINYTARVGFMPIRNVTTGQSEGHMFYTYYAKDGVTDPATRPLFFLFNGGPGSSTIWLEFGAFGPKIVKLLPDGTSPPPPYTYVDNPDTILDVADLVFLNPIGTAFSRPDRPDWGPKFWGYSNDIASTAEFIREFLGVYDRWGSPRFVGGESYGTTRAAGLSGYLTDHDMPLNGVALISSYITSMTPSGDLANIGSVPTWILTAWYYKKLSPDLEKLTAPELAQQARDFVSGEYMQALYQGDRMPAAQREKVLDDLSRYTGLSKPFLKANDLKFDLGRWSTELFRDQNISIGRLDTRFSMYNPDAGAITTPPDASEVNIRLSFLSGYEQYLRHDLNFVDNDLYYVLGGGIGPWTDQAPPPGAVGALEDALNKNPHMHLYLAEGYFNYSWYNAEYWLHHLRVSDQVKQHNIQYDNFEAGHMMYIDAKAHAKLRLGMVNLVKNSVPQ